MQNENLSLGRVFQAKTFNQKNKLRNPSVGDKPFAITSACYTRIIQALHEGLNITHATYNSQPLCNVFANEKKIHLQNLIKHQFKDRRTNTLVRFKALLEIDPTIPEEITTAIQKYVVQILFSLEDYTDTPLND